MDADVPECADNSGIGNDAGVLPIGKLLLPRTSQINLPIGSTPTLDYVVRSRDRASPALLIGVCPG